MKNFLALLFGLSISLLMFLGFNILTKTSSDVTLFESPETLHPDQLRKMPPLEIFEKIDLSNVKQYPKDISPRDLDTSKKFPGFKKPIGPYHSVVTIRGREQPLYSIYIQRDHLGRRQVKTQPKPNRKLALVFIGCSYTYGEGVEDQQTFVSLLSERFPKVNVYNLGVGGVGLNKIYDDMQSKKVDFYFDLQETQLILVNTFLGDHLRRQTCDMSCYGRNKWMIHGPRFAITSSGDLRKEGLLSDIYPANAILNFIFGFRVLEAYAIRDKKVFQDSNLLLWQSLLNNIRTEYQKSFEVLDFYNYFPNSSSFLANQMIPRLERNGFKAIVGRRLTMIFPEHQVLIPADFHPTPISHQAMAEEIAWALAQDYEEFRESKNNPH